MIMPSLLGYAVFILMLEATSRRGLTRYTKRILTKLYARVVDANMVEIINTFWKEWKMFVQETGIFSKRNIWNVRDALDGKSTE